MKKNYGKDWEKHFALDWAECFPKQLLLRLKDSMSGYYGTSSNPCDFIAHVDDYSFMLEVKCHYGNTFPWSDFRQYRDLKEYVGLHHVCTGVVVWFIDHDLVIYAPTETVTKMMQDGKKSINVKDIKQYNIICIPSVKKRVFMKGDYTVLRGLFDESKDREIN